jgi:hypothetical protein
LSAAGAFPSDLVEAWYSRWFFPQISAVSGFLADSVAFSWLDLSIIAFAGLTAVCVRQRRFSRLLAAAALVYLFFFWGWGLNYHRTALETRLMVDPAGSDSAQMNQFVARAASEINRLYRERSIKPLPEDAVEGAVSGRVRLVTGRIDGVEWRSASRIKRSLFANPWFRIAGVDGLFNPIGHEPIINSSLLDIERPFVVAHELAHVRGYPVEGEANLIAVLATVVSSEPDLQYSGWIHLWLYLRTPELDKLLDAGPRQDLLRIVERARADQIRWVSNLQAAVLDWYLKANSVEEGVRSYAQVVLLAVGTQASWDRFR